MAVKTPIRTRRRQDKDEEETLPQLSDMEKRVAPNPYRSLRNAFFTHGIIKPYFDPGFDLSDFKAGARKAVEPVSRTETDSCTSQFCMASLANCGT